MRVNFQKQGGGGSQTGANFKHLAERPALVVGIVDSDRRSKNSPLGDTAWAACKAAAVVGARRTEEDREADRRDLPASGPGQAVARLIVLRVRELENLLPEALWSRSLREPEQTHRLADLARRSFIGEHGEPWIDLKTGLLCRKVSGPSQEAVYAREILSRPAQAEIRSPCAGLETCVKALEDRCDERLVSGLGDALPIVARALSEIPETERLQIFALSAHPELARVVLTLRDWGLAPPPVRT